MFPLRKLWEETKVSRLQGCKKISIQMQIKVFPKNIFSKIEISQNLFPMVFIQ